MSDNINNIAENSQNNIGFMGKAFNIFLDPKKTFHSLDNKPDWIMPLIVILIIAVTFTYLIMPIVMPIQMEKQAEKMAEQGMSAEQIETATATGEKIGKIVGPIAGGLSTFIMIMAIAALLLFIGNTMLGGKTTFKKIMSVITYTSLIDSLNSLIILPLILSKKIMEVHFSLATFLSNDASETILYQILKKFDLFAIWEVIVAGIGISIIYKFTTKKSITIVASLYIIYSIISLAWFSFTH